MLNDITNALYANKATLKSNHNFQYRVANIILHYICLITKHFFSQRLSSAAIEAGKTVKPSPLCKYVCQMIQMNSFLQPGQMAGHLQGHRNYKETNDDSDDKVETKHQSNKRNADGQLKCGKDRIIDKKTQYKKEPQEFPPKWKKALDAYIKKYGQNSLPSSMKIKEILQVDNPREVAEALGVNKGVCLPWACFGTCSHWQCYFKHRNKLITNFNSDKMCIILKMFEEGK